MKFKLRKQDRTYMVKMLRKLDSLTLAPTEEPDIYDINRIRSKVLGDNNIVRIFLDNNVLTRILNLPVENITNARKLTDEEKHICCMMGYFTYCGPLLIPNISMYESQSTPSPASRLEAELKFRYFDHLPSQIYMDLALERINVIPSGHWSNVVEEVENNALTQADIDSNPYTGNIDSLKAFSLNLMKAWLLYKEDLNFEDGYETLMDWIHTNSIADQNCMLFFVFFMSRAKLGALIKKINSKDPNIVIKNIYNAAWDLVHLNIFLMVAQKQYKDGLHAFCSRDKLCHDLLRVSVSIKNEQDFKNYLSANHTKKQSALITKIRDRHNNRTDRKQYIESVEAELDNKLEAMETEIRNYLQK